MTDRSILVVDDEDSICLAFRRFFERRGWRVYVAASGTEGVSLYKEKRPRVVFVDVRLPDGNGLERIQEILGVDPEAHVIVITAYGGLNTAMQSLARRAFDYLPKPVDLDQAHELALRALEDGNPPPDSPAEQSLPGGEIADPEQPFVGDSPAMRALHRRIAIVARGDSTVLLQGATGTGKEVVARIIHQNGSRRNKAFVAVNCGAIPVNLMESELFGHAKGAYTGADSEHPGRFEQANGGTLFLDEVGELPPSAQVKLLRVLDSHIVERIGSHRPIQLDLRIVAASNRDLESEVRQGHFRADLYYRLAVVQIAMPPLAARTEDIVPLAEHFLATLGAERRRVLLTASAKAALLKHSWPGNVRELRNAMEHALAVAPSGRIVAEDLPDSVLSAGLTLSLTGPTAADNYLRHISEAPPFYQAAVTPVERAAIRRALVLCNGNQSEAAAFLGLHRNTVRRKIRELGIVEDRHQEGK